MEIRDLLSSYDFPGDEIPIIKGSALAVLENGDPKIGHDSIIELMKAVDSYIPQPERPKDKPFLMPIEDVFSISGRGTVVTGRVERGVLHVGDEIEIVGIKPTQKTTCTGIEMFRKLLDEGEAGDNIGVLLRGTKREEVERGQVLAAPGSITPHTKFTCECYILTKEEGGRHTPVSYTHLSTGYMLLTANTVSLPVGRKREKFIVNGRSPAVRAAWLPLMPAIKRSCSRLRCRIYSLCGVRTLVTFSSAKEANLNVVVWVMP